LHAIVTTELPLSLNSLTPKKKKKQFGEGTKLGCERKREEMED